MTMFLLKFSGLQHFTVAGRAVFILGYCLLWAMAAYLLSWWAATLIVAALALWVGFTLNNPTPLSLSDPNDPF